MDLVNGAGERRGEISHVRKKRSMGGQIKG